MHNTFSVGKPDGKRPLGRSRRRWKESVRFIKKIGFESVNCIILAQDRERWRKLIFGSTKKGNK
jgi:hypothetical protein